MTDVLARPTLRAYQEEAVAFLLSRDRAIEGDAPGIGKTATVISSLVCRTPQPSPALVLAPLSVVRHWEREIGRWSGYEAVVGVGSASQRRQARADLLYGDGLAPAIYVTNYEAAKADKSGLFEIPWRAVIADEAHRLRNRKTATFKVVRQLALPAPIFIAVTGPQPVWCKILTPSGWREMGEMRQGDPIIGRDGQTYEVTGFYPQGEQEIYKLTTTDYGETYATADHLWSVNFPDRVFNKRPFVTMTTAEMMRHGLRNHNNYTKFLPVPEPFAGEDRELPINPYLLGLLLGDGSFCNRHVSIANTDAEILQAVRDLLPEGVTMKPGHHDSYSLTVKSGQRNPLQTSLKQLSLMGLRSAEKFIPARYLFASRSSRTAVLQGLMDSDGHVTKQNHMEFSSVSEQLALGVVSLARSLGGLATIRKHSYDRTQPKRRNNQDRYRVSVSLGKGIEPFRISRKLNRWKVQQPRKRQIRRKIRSIELVGVTDVACISTTIPDQLYVTDDFVVTHNTPVVNRADDLWSLMHLVDAKNHRSYWKWVDTFMESTTTTFNGKLAFPIKQVTGMRPGMDGVLRQHLRDMMIRRSLSELLPELPEVSETIYEVDLSPEERKVYTDLEKRYFADLPDGSKVIAPNDVAKIMRLRQLSTDWSVLGATEQTSTKVKRLYELLDDIGDEQVVIFSAFSSVIDPIAAHLGAGKITGDVKSNDRADVLAAFKAGNLQYVCGTIAAMGEGIDLQTARHVVFLDLHWAPSGNEQCIARVHRYGQKADAVFVHTLAARNTIDAYIAKTIANKQSVIDAVVGLAWSDVTRGAAHGA